MQDDAASEFQQLRKELLKDTKEANARMMSAMQASGADPMSFLPEARPGVFSGRGGSESHYFMQAESGTKTKVRKLKEEYQQLLLDRLRSCASYKSAEDPWMSP